MPAPPSNQETSDVRITLVSDEGDGACFTFPIATGIVRIGRAIDNDIVLSDERVSRMHARVSLGAQRCEIEDQGSRTGIMVNGEVINAATRLRANDLVRLGTTLLRFDSERLADQPPAARASEPLATLVVTTKSGREPHEYPLSAGEYTIGRDPGCDIVLSGEAVSRYHARLSVSAERAKIVDLGSASGTSCNGTELTASRNLRPKDTLRMGPYTLEFSLAERTPASAEQEGGRRVALEHTMIGSVHQFKPAETDFVLICLSGSARGIRYPLAGDEMSLGSASNCQPRLTGVPAHAAILKRDGDGFQLAVAPGASGIRVGGGRKPPCKIAPGDLIDLGGSVFRLSRRGDAFTPRFDASEFDAPSAGWQRLVQWLKSRWHWPPWD
ncbi:MAG: FHA domain-containing protein [Rhodanobacteraceae bacterium]